MYITHLQTPICSKKRYRRERVNADTIICSQFNSERHSRQKLTPRLLTAPQSGHVFPSGACAGATDGDVSAASTTPRSASVATSSSSRSHLRSRQSPRNSTAGATTTAAATESLNASSTVATSAILTLRPPGTSIPRPGPRLGPGGDGRPARTPDTSAAGSSGTNRPPPCGGQVVFCPDSGKVGVS